MRKLLLTVALGFAFLGATAQANNLQTKEIAVSVSGVYIPSGFDSKSDAYVVVNGLFPNTCYSMSEARVENKSATEHVVRTIAKVVQQSICIRVFVPFNQEISLGNLSSGTHTVDFVADDGTSFQKTFTVE